MRPYANHCYIHGHTQRSRERVIFKEFDNKHLCDGFGIIANKTKPRSFGEKKETGRTSDCLKIVRSALCCRKEQLEIQKYNQETNKLPFLSFSFFVARYHLLENPDAENIFSCECSNVT